MRGSGYAIGEILIFLAIAGIIGFLVGWVVFYRRPDKRGSDLSTANPNHVRQLEARTRAAESKLGRIEQRASALLATLDKRGARAVTAAATGDAGDRAPGPSSGADSRIAPAAAAPEGAGKLGPRETGEASPPEGVEAAPISAPGKATDDGAEEVAETTQTTATGEAASEEPAADARGESATEEPDRTETAEGEAEPATKDESEVAAGTGAPESPGRGDEAAEPVEGDEGPTDADDRLAKLEATLDKLSERLAELDDN